MSTTFAPGFVAWIICCRILLGPAAAVVTLAGSVGPVPGGITCGVPPTAAGVAKLENGVGADPAAGVMVGVTGLLLPSDGNIEFDKSGVGEITLLWLYTPCAVLGPPTSAPPVEKGIKEFFEPPMGAGAGDVPVEPVPDELLTAPNIESNMLAMSSCQDAWCDRTDARATTLRRERTAENAAQDAASLGEARRLSRLLRIGGAAERSNLR